MFLNSLLFLFIAVVDYLLKTWIGCQHRPHFPPGPAQQVDTYIRNHIRNNNLGQRQALFPIPLWNVSNRVQLNLSRTNNALESFYHAWNGLIISHPKLSRFIKRLLKEETRWVTIVQDFRNNPGDGIGGGKVRRDKWVRQDASLRQFLNEFDTRDPFRFLRRVARKIAHWEDDESESDDSDER